MNKIFRYLERNLIIMIHTTIDDYWSWKTASSFSRKERKIRKPRCVLEWKSHPSPLLGPTAPTNCELYRTLRAFQRRSSSQQFSTTRESLLEREDRDRSYGSIMSSIMREISRIPCLFVCDFVKGERERERGTFWPSHLRNFYEI